MMLKVCASLTSISDWETHFLTYWRINYNCIHTLIDNMNAPVLKASHTTANVTYLEVVTVRWAVIYSCFSYLCQESKHINVSPPPPGAVGGGHVVLLYPPDDDRALPQLMCHLGSSLQALGFSVSLDLWSQAELSLLGPVPWLHSRLDRLKRQGGKVVLVLTQATWIKAEEWGARSWERSTAMEKSKDGEKKEAGRSYAASSRCVDVFSASLSCILADYLQGRAGERFMLVQFESLPPEPPGCFRPLPELFRGLHVYSLPSQSLGFLTELAGARQAATASARRKRAGGLRVASRALARGLSGYTAGTTVLRLAGVSQSCVGVGLEDSGEMVPLQPCLITPPSSPDTSPKVNDTEWVWQQERTAQDQATIFRWSVMTWQNLKWHCERHVVWTCCTQTQRNSRPVLPTRCNVNMQVTHLRSGSSWEKDAVFHMFAAETVAFLLFVF